MTRSSIREPMSDNATTLAGITISASALVLIVWLMASCAKQSASFEDGCRAGGGVYHPDLGRGTCRPPEP